MPKLSQGCLFEIWQGTKIEKPVLQVLNLQNNFSSDPKKFKLILSDSRYYVQSVGLTSDNAYLIEQKLLDKLSVVELIWYV